MIMHHSVGLGEIMDLTTKKSSDLFFATFLGEYVEILTKYEAGDQGKMMVQGYLLDMDNDYYFIGHNEFEVSAAIKKDNVSFISISSKVDPNVELLENMPVPDDEYENN